MPRLEIKNVKFVKSAVAAKDHLRDGRPQIAFAGRSNVGKSSLINLLLNQKLARTSATPGKTREVNYFLINNAFYFVDLPGYGYAKVAKTMRDAWRPMVENYIVDNEALRGLILLIDVRRAPSDMDLQLAAWLEEQEIPYLPVLTKRDKVSNNELQMQLRATRKALDLPADEPIVTFSSIKKQGRDELLELIRDLLEDEGEA